MKHKNLPSRGSRWGRSGMTVIELTLTLSLMLSLSAVIIFSVHGIGDWKLARIAGEDVRSVYLAQKSYLADHPTANISDLTAADLVPYLPGGRSAIPTVESLEGDTLSIDFNSIPPVIVAGAEIYDPSPKPTDSLWDAGVK